MADAIAAKPGMRLVVPRLKDPRITIAAALTLWTVLGQTAYYFNNNPVQLGAAIVTAIALDMILAAVVLRQVMVPLSAYITGLSIGILLASDDWRVFAVAAVWGILSKYLLRANGRHFFNPSNFAIVLALLLSHGRAIVAPGSQWGADYRIAAIIIILGLVMMKRVKRLDLALAWFGGFVVMGLLRMALGQGGLVFALGPITGAEFALFTFSMMPDPKASPLTRRSRIAWGLSIAVMDGAMRFFEIRYSMFYALFIHTALLPVVHWVIRRRGAEEHADWNAVQVMLRPSTPERVEAPLAAATPRQTSAG